MKAKPVVDPIFGVKRTFAFDQGNMVIPVLPRQSVPESGFGRVPLSYPIAGGHRSSIRDPEVKAFPA